MKRLLLAALIGSALVSPAWAQNAVIQSGTIVNNRPAKWLQTRTIGDSGGLTGDGAGVGLVPFAVTDSLALGQCFNSAATTGEYNALCLGHDSSGNGLITLDSNGGLAAKTLQFRINGNLYDFPGNGQGTVLGPATTVVGNWPLWNNTTGSLLSDSGITVLQGDVSATLPYQVTPIYASAFVKHTYDASFNPNFNVFANAWFVKGETSANTVAQFGMGEGAINGNTSWGGNHVGVASVAGSTAIAEELNCSALDPAATSHCLVIAGAGTNALEPAIQIQTNTAAAVFSRGILFNNPTFNAVSGALIEADSATIAEHGMLLGGTFSVGELATPSFGVAATPGSLNSKVLVTGSASANPSIGAAAAGSVPATNANLVINALGTGQVQVNAELALLNLPVSGDGSGVSLCVQASDGLVYAKATCP